MRKLRHRDLRTLPIATAEMGELGFDPGGRALKPQHLANQPIHSLRDPYTLFSFLLCCVFNVKGLAYTRPQ